jgi:predicted secreted protein
MAGKAGFRAVLTVGGVTIGKAQDVSPKFEGKEIQTTVREDNGWHTYIQGIKGWTADVDQLWVPDNTSNTTLTNAYLNGTVVAVSMLDEDGYGFSGSAIVTNLEPDEPLEDALTLKATLRGTGALIAVTPTS